MNEQVQLLIETYYFRLPKQIKGLNKELLCFLGTSFKNRSMLYENKGARIYYYPASFSTDPLKNFDNQKTENLLLIYAIINRSYILDLYSGCSLIEYLNGQGFNIFLLEWITEPASLKALSIEEQIFSHMMDAIKETLKVCQINKINIAGYCQGGTYALIALYFYPELFNRAVLYNTPVDFTTAGLFQFTKLLPPLIINSIPVDNMPFQLTDIPTCAGDFLLFNESIILPFINNYKWFRAVNKWENDAVPMSKYIFTEWIRFFYQENRLVNNELSFYGKKIILDDIKTPILSIVAEIDDIAPKEMSVPIKTRLPKGKELCIPGGHLSTTAGHFAINHSWPATVNWFKQNL